jgi:hypothetical protein
MCVGSSVPWAQVFGASWVLLILSFVVGLVWWSRRDSSYGADGLRGSAVRSSGGGRGLCAEASGLGDVDRSRDSVDVVHCCGADGCLGSPPLAGPDAGGCEAPLRYADDDRGPVRDDRRAAGSGRVVGVSGRSRERGDG